MYKNFLEYSCRVITNIYDDEEKLAIYARSDIPNKCLQAFFTLQRNLNECTSICAQFMREYFSVGKFWFQFN